MAFCEDTRVHGRQLSQSQTTDTNCPQVVEIEIDRPATGNVAKTVRANNPDHACIGFPGNLAAMLIFAPACHVSVCSFDKACLLELIKTALGERRMISPRILELRMPS